MDSRARCTFPTPIGNGLDSVSWTLSGHDELTILLQETLKRAASRPAIEPDRDFIYRFIDGRLKNEEEGTGRVVLVDRDRARIEFTNVIVNIRERVDKVLW